MGMFDYIEAKCPTPGCKGSLGGQTKGGECMMNTFEIKDQMDIQDARAVDGEDLHCPACYATARVRAIIPENPPTVEVKLEDVKVGDVNNTVIVHNFALETWPDSDPEFTGHLGHIRRMGSRRRDEGKCTYENPTREEYMRHQSKAGIEGDEPTYFEYVDGETRIQGRTWTHFKENK